MRKRRSAAPRLMRIRLRTAALAAVIVPVLAGCSAPGPLATRLQEPQSSFDRVVALEVGELNPGSARYLGKHENRRYWVGTAAENGSAHCLAILDEPTGLWVLLGCGALPLSAEWNGWSARLVPDGADTAWAVGEWAFVTPNLLVQEFG